MSVLLVETSPNGCHHGLFDWVRAERRIPAILLRKVCQACALREVRFQNREQVLWSGQSPGEGTLMLPQILRVAGTKDCPRAFPHPCGRLDSVAQQQGSLSSLGHMQVALSGGVRVSTLLFIQIL